MSQMSR